MSQRLTQLADELLPLLVARLTSGYRAAAASGGGATLGEHLLSGPLHSGTLGDSQGPQFLKTDGSRSLTGDLAVASGKTVDGIDISAHASNPNAHHNAVTAGAGIVESSQQISLAASVAGAGLGYAAGVLSVGVANTGATGLTAEADGVRLTSSSAPGEAASVLATDVSGLLTLVRLQTTLKVTTPLIDTASGDLMLNAASNRIIVPYPVAYQNYDYASQTTGWRIDFAGAADFRYLFVDELHAKSFIADLEQALAGGQIIGKSVAMVGAAFTAPAAGGTATLTVKDLPSAEGMPTFQSGDIVRLRTFSRSGGSLTIADCWGVVTSHVDLADRLQSWTFTRSSAPNAGAMSAGTVVNVDSIVLDYGTTGMGIHEINAIDGAYGANSPYAQVVTWAGHPATGQTVRTRTGNLYGLFSVAGEFGLYAGNGVTDADAYLRMSSYTSRFNNLTSQWFSGGNKIVGIDTTNGIDIVASTSSLANNRAYSFSNAGSIFGGLFAWYDDSVGQKVYNVHLLSEISSATHSPLVSLKANNLSTGGARISLSTGSSPNYSQLDMGVNGEVFLSATNSYGTKTITLSGGSLLLPDPTYADSVRARTGSGLKLLDDGGNLGIFVEDGGFVGINNNNPAAALHVTGTLLIDGDQGGVADTIGLTDVSVGVGSGVGTVKMAINFNRNSTHWIKMYVGTTAVYVPAWSTIY